jgi:hypothetical protein
MTADELIDSYAVKGAASLVVLVTLVDLALRTRRRHVRQAVEMRD